MLRDCHKERGKEEVVVACFIQGVFEACSDSPEMSPKPGLIPSAVSVAWFLYHVFYNVSLQ